MQLELELPARARAVREIPVSQAVGEVYAGPVIQLGMGKALQPGNVILPWQAQWLETCGYVDVHVNEA